MHRAYNTLWYTCKAFIALTCALVISLALISYSPEDRSIMYDTSGPVSTHNYLGPWGAQLAGLLVYLFGGAAWLLICICLYISYICTVYRVKSTRAYYSTISAIGMVFVIGMLFSAYIQVYSGVCGIVLLEYLQAFLEPWQIALFLYFLLWAFAVLCIFEPFYCFCFAVKLQTKELIKNLVATNKNKHKKTSCNSLK